MTTTVTETGPATGTEIEIETGIATGIGTGTTDSVTTNEETVIGTIEEMTVTVAVPARETAETDPLLLLLPTPRSLHRRKKRQMVQLRL